MKSNKILPLLTEEETAKILRVSTSYLLKQRRCKKIDYVTIGRGIRYEHWPCPVSR